MKTNYECRPAAADLSAMLNAHSGGDAPDIIAAEACLRRAQLAADVEALDALIGEPLLFCGPDGNLASKDQDLDLFRRGVVRFLAHEPQELHLQWLHLDVVAASLKTSLQVSVNGRISSGIYRYLRVWRRSGRKNWQVVAGQVGAVPATTESLAHQDTQLQVAR